MRLVCIADTHGMHRDMPPIPNGDVLIHAGDCLGAGSLDELEEFDQWLGSLPHRHKILIAGNHDWAFEETPEAARLMVRNAHYLEDSGIEIEGVRFWGSPWTPRFRDWAFNLTRGEPLAKRWAQIPEATDVLITHGPPWGILDEAGANFDIQMVGCHDLLERLASLSVKAHVFGHIHECYGTRERDGIQFINASTCDERYRPTNRPIMVDL